LLALLIAHNALASGFYHPNDVAAASQRFAEAQSQLMAPLEGRQQQARELSNALRSYREGLDALGGQAPQAQREHLEQLEADYLRRFEALQRFADTLVDDFDAAFSASMERALAAHPGAAACVREVAVGPRVPGMAGRTQRNPECTGSDLNAAVAAAIDADEQLAAALPGVLGRPWPELSLPATPQAPVGGEGRYLHVQALLTAGAGAALRAIDRDDDDERMAIEARLEDGADAAEVAQLQKMGEQIAASTASKRAALAHPILEASNKALAKRGEPVGWCVQPERLGGCVGDDASAELVPALLADKKVAKALP
jgi:hypothetical protein